MRTPVSAGVEPAGNQPWCLLDRDKATFETLSKAYENEATEKKTLTREPAIARRGAAISQRQLRLSRKRKHPRGADGVAI